LVDGQLTCLILQVMSTPTIHFTPAALQWLSQQRQPKSRLQVGLKKSGCAGFEHFLIWQNSLDQGKVEANSNAPFPVVLEENHQLSLDGLEIDLQKRGLNQELVWKNPNAAHECGCGVSFSFAEPRLHIVS